MAAAQYEGSLLKWMTCYYGYTKLLSEDFLMQVAFYLHVLILNFYEIFGQSKTHLYVRVMFWRNMCKV